LPAAFPLDFAVVVFAFVALALPGLVSFAPAPVRAPEPLPADPTSLFVMTGTGAAVARAIVFLSSSPGSPGSTSDVLASSRRRVVRPA
jgi:hypothetical protein